jgi:hypothetical protein
MLSPFTDIKKMVFGDYPVSNTEEVDPTDADCFEQGMWFCLDTAASGKVKLGTGAAAAPCWSRKGEPSTQALGKVTLIIGGMLEAETDQYSASPSPAFAIGDSLYVDADGKLTNVSTGTQVAVLLETPAENANGNLKFRRILLG